MFPYIKRTSVTIFCTIFFFFFFPKYVYVLVMVVVVETVVSISRIHGRNYRRMIVAEVVTVMMVGVRMVIYIS